MTCLTDRVRSNVLELQFSVKFKGPGRGTNLEQLNQRIASETTETLLHMIRQNMELAELQRTIPAHWEAADEDIRIVGGGMPSSPASG